MSYQTGLHTPKVSGVQNAACFSVSSPASLCSSELESLQTGVQGFLTGLQNARFPFVSCLIRLDFTRQRWMEFRMLHAFPSQVQRRFVPLNSSLSRLEFRAFWLDFRMQTFSSQVQFRCTPLNSSFRVLIKKEFSKLLVLNIIFITSYLLFI